MGFLLLEQETSIPHHYLNNGVNGLLEINQYLKKYGKKMGVTLTLLGRALNQMVLNQLKQ